MSRATHVPRSAQNAPQPLHCRRPDQMLTNPIFLLNSIANAVEKNRPSYFPPHFVMRATRSKRLFACIDAVAGGRQSSSPDGIQSRFQSGGCKNSRCKSTGPAPRRKRDGGFTGELPSASRGLGSTAAGTRFGKAVHTAVPETGGGGPRSSTARVGVTLYSRDNGMPNANRTARAAVP